MTNSDPLNSQSRTPKLANLVLEIISDRTYGLLDGLLCGTTVSLLLLTVTSLSFLWSGLIWSTVATAICIALGCATGLWVGKGKVDGAFLFSWLRKGLIALFIVLLASFGTLSIFHILESATETKRKAEEEKTKRQSAIAVDAADAKTICKQVLEMVIDIKGRVQVKVPATDLYTQYTTQRELNRLYDCKLDLALSELRSLVVTEALTEPEVVNIPQVKPPQAHTVDPVEPPRWTREIPASPSTPATPDQTLPDQSKTPDPVGGSQKDPEKISAANVARERSKSIFDLIFGILSGGGLGFGPTKIDVLTLNGLVFNDPGQIGTALASADQALSKNETTKNLLFLGLRIATHDVGRSSAERNAIAKFLDDNSHPTTTICHYILANRIPPLSDFDRTMIQPDDAAVTAAKDQLESTWADDRKVVEKCVSDGDKNRLAMYLTALNDFENEFMPGR